MVKQRTQELVRAYLNDEGVLEVFVAGFCPDDEQEEIAKQTADAIVRVIGEDTLRGFGQLKMPTHLMH